MNRIYARSRTDDWRRNGACWPPADLHGDRLVAHVARWFPASYGRGARPIPDVEAARTICRSCPVQDACLAYALSAVEPDGIWGGTTPDERRRMRGAA